MQSFLVSHVLIECVILFNLNIKTLKSMNGIYLYNLHYGLTFKKKDTIKILKYDECKSTREKNFL